MAKKKTGKKKQSKELVKVKPRSVKLVEETETSHLLRMAVDKNLDVDKLEKLIELKNKEEARLAKKDFDLHFGMMQAEFPTVRKTKEAQDINNKLLYKYCPLENIVKVLGPVIKNHGFTYWFSSEMVKENEMRIFCHISGWGHEKTNHIDFPVIPGTRATNKIQERGITESYGQRYAFKAGFGFVIAGEDDESNMASKPDIDEPEEIPTDEKLKRLRKDCLELVAKVRKHNEDDEVERFKTLCADNGKDYAALKKIYDEWNVYN